MEDQGATYPVIVDPWIQQEKLTAADAPGDLLFGTSVAVSGDTAIVGAPYSHYAPGGAAYVFVVSCLAGQYSNGTACVDADPGYYVPDDGATSQTACPVGYYQPDSGQMSCIAASPGHFVELVGQTAETACAAGTYQPNSGATGCIVASPNFYVPSPGATEQLACPSGTTSPAGATARAPNGFAFTGFFAPVDNLPLVNAMKAGAAVPVKFSLGGDRGLAIFAAGFPMSQAIACDTGVTDVVEETVTAGGSSLSYDATTDQYKYVWKTDKAWKGTCRQLTVRFTDGTTRSALFTFQ